MPLFKKSKDKSKKNKSGIEKPHSKSLENNNVEETFEQPPQTFKHAPRLSKTSLDLGGLPINVFGLSEITPSASRASAPAPPELCVAIHMHGRGGSADNEEKLVRHLWDRVQRSCQEYGGATREFLIVNFDGRNHGHRMTNEVGQKAWKQGNKLHGQDLYAMIVGMAQDVSFIVQFLPSYLFPHDDRRITTWAVTGKSLGGHAAWHVLANDAKIKIGVPLISCPDYATLIADRTRTNFVTNGPPYIPASLSSLISSIDPAARAYDSFDRHNNPFWGKKICMCSGRADKLVPWRCAEKFVNGLVTGEPEGEKGEMSGLRLVLLEDIGHQVTDSMLEEGGHWLYIHGVR